MASAHGLCREELQEVRTLVEAQSLNDAQAHLDQNVLARYAVVAPASILGLSVASFRPPYGPVSARSHLFGANVSLENRD